MPMQCCVPFCDSLSQSNFSFHRFPRNIRLRQQWVKIIGHNPKTIHQAKICSRHFSFIDFNSGPDGRFYLKANSVPTKRIPRSSLAKLNIAAKKRRLAKRIRSTVVQRVIGTEMLVTELKQEVLEIEANDSENCSGADNDNDTDTAEELPQTKADFNIEAVLLGCDETEPLGKYTTGNDPLDIPKTPKQNIPYDPNSCSVTGCSVSSKTNPTMRFYAIPVSTNNAPASYQHIENKRRLAWFEGVDLKVEAKRFNSMRICANHFRYGRPANVLNYCHVDWMPSINVGGRMKQFNLMIRGKICKWLFKDYVEEEILTNSSNITIGDAVDSGCRNTIVQNDNYTSNRAGSLIGKANDALVQEDNFKTKASAEKMHPVRKIRQYKQDYSNRVSAGELCLSVNPDHGYCKKMSSANVKNLLSKTTNMATCKNLPKLPEPATTSPSQPRKLPAIICLPCSSNFPDFTSYYIHKFQNVICMLTQKCCEICEVYIYDDTALKTHMKTHTIPRGYFCKICKLTKSGSTIEQMDHMRIMHTDLQKYFICDNCGKTMTDQMDLLAHIKVNVCFATPNSKDLPILNNKIDAAANTCSSKKSLTNQASAASSTEKSTDKNVVLLVVDDSNKHSTSIDEIGQKYGDLKTDSMELFYISLQNNDKNQEMLPPSTVDVSDEDQWMLPPLELIEPASPMNVNANVAKTPKQIKMDKLKSEQLTHDLLNIEQCKVNLELPPKKEKQINEPLMCELCGKFPKSMFSHMQIHYDIRPHKCDYCNRSFRTSHYLNKHKNSHEQNRYECDLCPKSFLWFDQFRCHMQKIHPQCLDLFVCPICSRTFQHNAVLMYHIRAHRTFECYICKCTYKRIRGLKTHMNFHKTTEEKRLDVEQQRITAKSPVHRTLLQCMYCAASFMTKHTLALHTRNHTVERLYHCKLCLDSRIGTELEEKEHIASHQSGQGYICEYCGKSYFAKINYIVHMRTHVGQSLEIPAATLPTNHQTNTGRMSNSTVPTRPQQIVVTPIIRTVDTVQAVKSSSQTFLKPITAPKSHDSVAKIIKSFNCNECVADFQNEVDFIRHKSIAHRKKYRCNLCKQPVIDNLSKHILMHQTCVECKLNLGSRAAYLKHNKDVHKRM